MSAAEHQAIDPARVAGLYSDYADELRAFLTGVLRNADQAAEVLQATFARTLESGHTAKDETIKGWLFRVALNEALLLKRRQKRHTDALAELQTNPQRTNAGRASEETPDLTVCRWESVEKVRSELERLPPEQRQVVRMRIYEGKTFAVIAAELEVPLGTVLTRMRLALKKLSSCLGPGQSEP